MSLPFLIATISNDLEMYARMRTSMAAVGLDERTCRFALYDNTQGNTHDPYAILRQLPDDGTEPYIVLCHQDLLFDQASSLAVLERLLNELDQRHPRWCIAGPAGMDRHAKHVLHMDDPAGSWRHANLPRKVISLDEHFLVMRRDRYVRPSPGLSGFHLYGTDLCLNGILRRRTAHVIAFPLHHLSAGNPDSAAFKQALAGLTAVWRRRLLIGVVGTLCSEFRVSSIRPLELLVRRMRTTSLLRWLGWTVLRNPLWSRADRRGGA